LAAVEPRAQQRRALAFCCEFFLESIEQDCLGGLPLKINK
jgi:hypothetical protein